MVQPPFYVPRDVLDEPEVGVDRHDAPIHTARALVVPRLAPGLPSDCFLLNLGQHPEVENHPERLRAVLHLLRRSSLRFGGGTLVVY